jgi:hypothetical protein
MNLSKVVLCLNTEQKIKEDEKQKKQNPKSKRTFCKVLKESKHQEQEESAFGARSNAEEEAISAGAVTCN